MSQHVAVREYKSRHDRIAELPLVIESATVTDVTAMDRHRRSEARKATNQRLRRRGLEDSYRLPTESTSPDEWNHLGNRLAVGGRTSLARTAVTLGERATRPKPMSPPSRLSVPEPFDYLAGQYIGLRYDGTSRVWWLVSTSKSNDDLEVCVRRVPDGRLSLKLCGDLEVGGELTVRGPTASLFWANLLLATGTGVAPLKGMTEEAFATGRDEFRGTTRDVWLFLGAAWADDLPYHDRFQELPLCADV